MTTQIGYERGRTGTHPGGRSHARCTPSQFEASARLENFGPKRDREIRCNFSEADVEREERTLEAVLQEAGLINQVRSGREAAFANLVDDELCRKLTGKFARESAKKTGDQIGAVRDCYETIVTEFLFVD